jgi:AraC-like DNA-binding protein
MEVIFLLGSVQAFFFATLFFSRNQSSLPHKVLIVFFVLNGLLLLDHFLEFKGIIFDYPHLIGLTYTLPTLLGPIIFYYTLILINENRPDPIKLLAHLSPFIILTTYFLFDFYFLGAEEKLEYYYRESDGDTSVMIYVAEVLLNFSLPVYSVWSLYYLRKHLREIKRKFSYTEEINLKWLAIILYLFVAISVVVLLTNLLSDVIPVFQFWFGDSLAFAALTIAIFFIGYYGIKQQAIYSNNPIPYDEKNDVRKKKQYLKSGLKANESKIYHDQLLRLMEEEKLHRDSKLSLKHLAIRMSISENNLSQLINERLNKNFYDFVNEYRVSDVKKMIENPKFAHYSLLGMAMECGFNSKSSFNSIFKQQTGMTPSEFKKSANNL